MATFDLELTISGLCAIVLKADEEYPSSPTEVDVLAVGHGAAGHGAAGGENDAEDDTAVHKPRLSFWPRDQSAWTDPLKPRLHITPRGEKQAVLDLDGKIVKLDCGLADRVCRVGWTSPAATGPHGILAERLFNWVPSAKSLGIDRLRIPAGADDLPAGSICRLALPAGELGARSVVRDDRGEPLLWTFPADQNKKRAIANDVVFRATSIDNIKLTIVNSDGREGYLDLGAQPSGTVYLNFSNDVEVLPKSFHEQQTLDHLKHLSHVALEEPDIQPPHTKNKPYTVGRARTGWPICHQVYYLNLST